MLRDLRNLKFIGFDQEGENEEEEEEENEEEDEEKDSKKGGKDEGEGNVEGLKSALRKERRTNRETQKRLRQLEKTLGEREDKEKDDVTKATDRATSAEAKAQKLATQLRTSALDNAIIKQATSLGFADVDDALKLVDRNDIDVEQDEDDPSLVEIDKTSVKDALEALKKAKPHLIKASDETGNPRKTGSSFGGGKKKTQDELDEEALLARYPALRRGQAVS